MGDCKNEVTCWTFEVFAKLNSSRLAFRDPKQNKVNLAKETSPKISIHIPSGVEESKPGRISEANFTIRPTWALH